MNYNMFSSKHDKPQPLWDSVLEQKPDLWIWLGDGKYGLYFLV